MKQKTILSLILAVELFFMVPSLCKAGGVTFSGGLETNLNYSSLIDPSVPVPQISFGNNLNLKLDVNDGEKQSGVVLLQYKYLIPSATAQLTDYLVINQAYLDLQFASNSLLRLGRQKISWGTGLVWNPTNYIGADKNRADLTTEYPGVDAINYVLNWDQSSGVLLLKPDLQGQFNDWGRAVKLAFQVFHCDLSSSVYQQGDANAYGADFATTLGDYTVYTELSSKTGKMFYIDNSGDNLLFRPGDQRYMHGAIGLQGILGNDWMIQLEYYYNQEGWDNQEAQNYRTFLSRGHLLPENINMENYFADQRQHYLFAMIRKNELIDDLTLSTNIFWNMDDQSFLFTPMFDYRVGQNTMATLMIHCYGGAATSEFGSLFYCQVTGKVQVSF